MENGKITIYDVAERAGVSIATVSRAMSGGSISAKSRQKVQEAIEALHYQPSTAHSHPQGQEKRTGTLALVIGDFDNPYCSMLMRGAAGWSAACLATATRWRFSATRRGPSQTTR